MVEVPFGVVTVILTVPAGPAGSAGEIAIICVSLITVNEMAGMVPKRTAVAPVKLIPVIVTVVCPHTIPSEGSIFMTSGVGGGRVT